MKKNFLILLSDAARAQQVAEQLRDAGVTVLALYGTDALEIFATDEQVHDLKTQKDFRLLSDSAISLANLKDISKETQQVVEAWNQRQASIATPRGNLRGGPENDNRGKSWGSPGFDEPRPHTDISGDFFLETLRKTPPDNSAPKARSGPGEGSRSYQEIYDRVLDKLGDATQAYHLARLAVIRPELEPDILELSEDDRARLFETPRTERFNLGREALTPRGGTEGQHGPSAGPEAACWRLDGEISVGILFVESSKSGGPKFSSADRTTLLSEVQTGLNWLAAQHPLGGVTWVYNTQYISIAVDNGNSSSDEAYWRDPAMKKVSYNSKTFSGNWNGVAAYREEMRVVNQSAHAIVVFITPYGTSWHAYASNGRLTLANRNNWGGWGINTIDAITAHEVCHLFGAADEYTGSGTPCNSCTTLHGCLGMPNGNCKACATTPVPCIMDGNSLSICGYTRGQLGWPQVWDWEQIDGGTGVKTIVAAGTSLYKLHTNGEIWLYKGSPNNWQKIDNNPATVAIAAAGANLYQLHSTGKIWKYTGVPLTGWQCIDTNPATKAITAAGNDIYQLHNTGKIWKYTGVPISGWQCIDTNPATVKIMAAGSNIYQVHNTGKIWKYTGVPITGWQLLNNNTDTKAIAAAGTTLYQLRNNGLIQRYNGTPNSWQTVDTNPATTAIVAAGKRLIQLHTSGRIWQYLGTPVTGWQLLDFNSATKLIVCNDTTLYQMHSNGKIWRFKGTLV